MSTHEPPVERPPITETPEKGTRLSAIEIHDNILAGATEEAARPTVSVWWSALASGLVIGFSFLAAAFLASLGTTEYARTALGALAYPLGFVFVVLGRSELFTENTLEPVIPLLHERTRRRLRELARMWAILLVGNLVGAVVFGALLARTVAVPEALHFALREISLATAGGGFLTVFYRAIWAGWLIALMAWLLGSTTARGAQMTIIWLCTGAISAFGFRHSIVGAVEVFYRVFSDAMTWRAAIFEFLVPAVLGNAVGGGVLVALLNYAQVRAELPARPRTRLA
jgi:formate/nitrite transporter FocA (FNT family)